MTEQAEIKPARIDTNEANDDARYLEFIEAQAKTQLRAASKPLEDEIRGLCEDAGVYDRTIVAICALLRKDFEERAVDDMVSAQERRAEGR